MFYAMHSKMHDRVLATVSGENGAIDFNRIIPMPELLRNTASGSRFVDGKQVTSYYTARVARSEIEMLEGQENKGIYQGQLVSVAPWSTEGDEITIERMFSQAEQEELETLGASNWYDWAVENWDTKWNAGEITEDAGCIEFSTAWAKPLPIFLRLSQLLPDIEFQVCWSEEQMTVDNGEMVLKSGEIISYQEDNSLEFAHSIWGFDPEEA
jgi:hypothetical protein